MKHFILFHKDYTKFVIKYGLDATWLPHSAPIHLICQRASEVGKSVEWIALCTRQGTSSFVCTLFHIFTGIQGARRKEWAPVVLLYKKAPVSWTGHPLPLEAAGPRV